MKFDKVALDGQHIMLEPLRKEHKEGLCEVISDGELWNLFTTLVPDVDGLDSFIEFSEKSYNEGDGVTFVMIDKERNKMVGSTRFMKANLVYKRVEIGYTFIAKSFQRTRVNTESKFLMLRYAFEKLNLNRVEFLTDYLNTRSRTAILRLGAKEEGVLRSHMVMPNGRVRDSVLFSVIKNEWPGVKQNLLEKLAKQSVEQ